MEASDCLRGDSKITDSCVNNENDDLKEDNFETQKKKMKISEDVHCRLDIPSVKNESTDEKTTDSNTVKSEENLSKRQKKRLLKKEKWLANLAEKRAKEKLRIKEKKAEARKNNLMLGPTRKQLKNQTMAKSKCKVKVVLDFSFEHLMTDKDLSKCVNQFLRCYSINRRSDNPMQFSVTSFSGKTKEMMSKHNGYQNWDVNFHEESYLDVFSKDSLVYLTSDSDNVINDLCDDHVYIIGALVDHNSQKGLCLGIANEQGINHGQLPIKEHFDMKTRNVLTINHVFEVLALVCNGLSWEEALLKVLPLRKGAKKKEDESEKEIVAEEKAQIVIN